ELAASIAAPPHHRCLLGRREIIARRQIDDRCRAEEGVDAFHRRGDQVSPAHRVQAPPVSDDATYRVTASAHRADAFEPRTSRLQVQKMNLLFANPTGGASMTASAKLVSVPPSSQRTSAAPASPRLERMLRGPIGPVLARLAAPNVAVVAAMTMVTVADAWFVSRIGIAALASLALVFPLQTLMQMMSAGAMGGGVSSAV